MADRCTCLFYGRGFNETRVNSPRCPEHGRPYPHSGVCARCRRDRDDLFWHAADEAFYCADVFACEYRYYLQGEREARRSEARCSCTSSRQCPACLEQGRKARAR